VYGIAFLKRLCAMGIRDHPIAPQSSWQNPHAERLIGLIRPEILDHVAVLGAAHLRPKLSRYVAYDNQAHTLWSLRNDCPIHRPIEVAAH